MKDLENIDPLNVLPLPVMMPVIYKFDIFINDRNFISLCFIIMRLFFMSLQSVMYTIARVYNASPCVIQINALDDFYMRS